MIHDLGHGPWSHAWDGHIANKSDNWTHEQGSAKLLDYILKTEDKVASIFEKFNLHLERNLEFIKELITAENSVLEEEWPFRSRPETHAWLFEIVSNHRFGVDVDRLDYA